MKSSSRSSSIYRNQNVLVRALFKRAGCSRKVLCVGLDYPKTKHVALICNGNGYILKAAFPVENTTTGVAHLIEQITATARRRKITKDCIFLGGEDEAAYVANFTAALRGKGYLVVRVNAYEAKESRENLLASTDNLDLLGVAKTLLARRARLPDHIATTAEVAAPCTCPHCQEATDRSKLGSTSYLQEDIVLRPRTIVTRQVHETAWCPGCRRKVFATLEGELPFAPIGPAAKAAALYLRHETKLPYRKLQKLMSDLLGLDFVPSSSLGFEKRPRSSTTGLRRSDPEDASLRSRSCGRNLLA